MADSKGEEICRRFDQLAGNRTEWENQWEEIAERVLPSYSGSFQTGAGYGAINTFAEASGGSGASTPGAKRTKEMVDATAALALPKFAAANESMLTPRGQTWHRLVAPDRKLMGNRAVREWFDETLRLLFRYRYAPNANFASQAHEIYMGLGAFGTSAMFIDALDKRYGGGLRYRAIHLGELFFMENHQGIIDTAYRKFTMTARQASQMFNRPDDVLPEEIRSVLGDAAKKDKPFTFLHCVTPRSDDEYDERRLDVKGMQFASYYVAVDGKQMVREGGYNKFPYAISRYVQAPGETYGRSPAMLALPDIKVLNEQKKTLLKQGHRAVDPVLLAHDDGVVDTFSMRPGAINFGGVNAEGRPLVHALPTGQISLAKEMMETQHRVINDAFLVTLFQILVETPQMTATEVLERAREKGALLSPTMGRQQSEFLGPLIDRELDVLASQNLLPEMPGLLKEAGEQYDVVYDSPLSRAQRSEEGAGFMRYLDYWQNYAQLTGDMSPMDWIDVDTAAPELAEINAVPARWTATPEMVMQKRNARAEAAQTQQMLDAAPAAAGVMKAMPKGAA
jgi:hypothetical protein